MMKAAIFDSIIETVNRGESAQIKIEYNGKEYIREFRQNDRLIILGGGHVGSALCRMAAMLDYSITVVDDRPAFANYERLPEADNVICDSFDHAIKELKIRSTDYVCVLTRGHRWDQQCVEAVLSGEMPYYFGMIGSRRRVLGMKECLAVKGFSAEKLDRLYAPIGLDIGAQTPMEIALSICAQMIQEKRKCNDASAENVLIEKNTDMKTLSVLSDADTPCAMLMVLASDGSTPTDSGAIMAVDSIGRTYGTIGGGCSEAAAILKARNMIGTGERAVLDFDMSSEVAEENGMVCGGCMTVLIEDVQP